MEGTENQAVTRGPGRPVNRRSKEERAAQLAERALRVRDELMFGKGEFEICRTLSITRAEYSVARKWIAKRWVDNEDSWVDFLITENVRVKELQEQIVKVESDETITIGDRARLVWQLVKAQHDIEFNIREMGLRLGMLDREAIKVDETRTVKVTFGDEALTPFYAPEKTIEVQPESVA